MRDRLLALIAGSGVPLEPFGAWIDAACAVGPTRPQGPLTHDLLVGEGSFGLTLFDLGDGLPLAVVRTVARGWGQEHVLNAFVAEEPAARLHSGLRWERGGTLKLYRTGAAMVGLDLRPQGPSRRRVYRVVDRPDLRGLPGYARTIEVALSAREARDRRAKATTAVIFRPGTAAPALEAAASRLRPDRRWTLPPTLRDLCAAALELDRWDDGSEAFDALVSVGVTPR